MKLHFQPRRLLVGALILLVIIGAALWTPDIPRSALETKYLAQPGDMRNIAGVRLHVRDTGPRTAPVLIMLHGFASSLHTWQPWADALDSTYRIVRFDLPGSGLSAPDPSGDYSDARTLSLMNALMDSLHIQRATIIGNSMGGRFAWQFAARYPARVSTLVLISPDGFASPGFEYNKAPEVPAALSLMRYVLPKWLLRMNLAPAYAHANTLTDSLTTRYYELLRAPGARAAMLQRMHETVLADPAPLLKQIQAPTLLLWGTEDAMIPFSNAADYLKLIPHATLVPLPGLGHLPFEEAPAAALVPLRAFLVSTDTLQ
jgi:pimeloyl-ACP methyl ester carboxylesterase